MTVNKLECWRCGQTYSPSHWRNLCECGKPLRVDYDLIKVSKLMKREDLAGRRKDLWRYREALPYPLDLPAPSLGEGGTPLLNCARLAQSARLHGELWIKDEAVNPTGSFKARGMAVAVAMAAHLGAKKLAAPSAGNAGGALAAYAALHGLEAHLFVPKDTPRANVMEAELAGAHVNLVDGLIHDCGRIVAERSAAEGWTDLSTLKEPYRVEGKKTMGYEIAEQLNWELPDVILYPTGGGTGLVGMWKAFDEMEAMGWIGSKRPRMVSVQAEGCQPIVRAWNAGAEFAETHEGAHTTASGLRVPRAIGDFIMLGLIRESQGTALAVPDDEMLRWARIGASLTGISFCPEGGACLAALTQLQSQGWVRPEDRVVVFNTGTAVKYGEAFTQG